MSGLVGNDTESYIGKVAETSTLTIRPGATSPDSTGGRVALLPAPSETTGAAANPIFVERTGTTLKFYQYGSGVDAGNAFGFFVNLASCAAGVASDFTPGSANTPWVPRTGGPVSSDLEISNDAPRVILRNTTASPVGNSLHYVNLSTVSSSSAFFAPGPVSGTYGDLRPISINLVNGNVTLAGWSAGTPAPMPNLAVQGTATFLQNVSFAGDVSIAGTLTSSTPNTFNTPVTFNSTTTTIGLATFSGGITVGGTATFNGPVNFGASFAFSSDVIIDKGNPQVILKDSTSVSTAFLQVTNSATGKAFYIMGADTNVASGPNANRPFWVNLLSNPGGGSVNLCGVTTDAANPTGLNVNGTSVFMKDVTMQGNLNLTAGNINPYRIFGSFADVTYSFPSTTLPAGGASGFTVSVPGAVIGDFVMWSASPVFNNQVYFQGGITSAGTITMQVRNLDSSSLTIGAKTIYFRVFRR